MTITASLAWNFFTTSKFASRYEIADQQTGDASPLSATWPKGEVLVDLKESTFRESAGATKIGYLLVSPLATGLFQRAILESPLRVLLPDPELKRPVDGLTPIERGGSTLAPHIAEARRWPAAETVRRAKAVADEMFAADGKGPLGLRPERPDAHTECPRCAVVGIR